jgi:hypothetical protein
MGLVEDQIAEMERRLQELQPLLEEADLLERSIARLRAELAATDGARRSRMEGMPAKAARFMELQEHMAVDLRKSQIAAILKEEPDATNRRIGSILGLSGARIGQIRKEMDAGDDRRTGS